MAHLSSFFCFAKRISPKISLDKHHYLVRLLAEFLLFLAEYFSTPVVSPYSRGLESASERLQLLKFLVSGTDPGLPTPIKALRVQLRTTAS